MECAAGALIGEVLGEAFSDTFLEGTNLSPEDYARRRELGIQLAKLGAATGALAFNRDPHIMVTTAENAAAHNSFLIREVVKGIVKETAKKGAKEAAKKGAKKQVQDNAKIYPTGSLNHQGNLLLKKLNPHYHLRQLLKVMGLKSSIIPVVVTMVLHICIYKVKVQKLELGKMANLLKVMLS